MVNMKQNARESSRESARESAAAIIGKVLFKNAYSNITLSNVLEKGNYNDKDKALITEIVYGTLKYKYTIDTILNSLLKDGIDSINPKVLNILRITIYQMRYLSKIPEFAAVNEAVEMSKKISVGISKLVNGVLRNYLRNKDAVYYNEENIIEKLCFQYSFSEWMVNLFINQFGMDAAEEIMRGLNYSPSVTVRVNNLKTNYDEVCEKLKEFGYEIEDGCICPEAIRIIRGKSIEHNPLFKEGYITVQDESAMLSALCMNLKENMTVLDLCSAPGGKATHISEIMRNTGKVKAFDIHGNKLSLIKQNASRLGIKNINCDIMDASVVNERLINSADCVLIDVPCSGLGIIRKKPEIKWNKNHDEIDAIIKTQRKIMNAASNYVRVGGTLLYSTCTINKLENDENIKWFLDSHPEYCLTSLYLGKLQNILYEPEGCITVLPNDIMDGFFIASLERRK